MQLNDLTENNLFNDLSEQEQEVVGGGYAGTFNWGSIAVNGAGSSNGSVEVNNGFGKFKLQWTPTGVTVG